MKSRFKYADLLVVAVLLLPYFYLSQVYQGLPAMVPTHFSYDGTPDDYSKRSFLWTLVTLMFALGILLYLLMRFLPTIDPKKKAQYSAGVFQKIGVAVAFLLCLISCFIIHSARVASGSIGGFLPVVLGLFFAFLGNVLHSIKPNYFAGIRTPWTLESEDTWRKTHQMGGKLWFAGGLVLALTGLFFPFQALKFFMPVLLGIMVIWPVAYSYLYFKSQEKKNNSN